MVRLESMPDRPRHAPPLPLALRGLHRHHRRVLGIAQRERGLDVAYVGRRGEFFDKCLEGLQIWRHAFEREVDLARQHPALPYQRLRTHEIFEGGEISLRLACQMHHGEHGDLIAELFFVEQRAVSLNKARLLQRPHTSQTWWRGNTDPTGKFDIGDASVVLQFLQDATIDRVKTSGHRRLPCPSKNAGKPSTPRNNLSLKIIAS